MLQSLYMNALIVANWKMHPKTLREAKRLVTVTKKALGSSRAVTVVVAPPAVFLRDLAKGASSRSLPYAAQNVHWEEVGAHTGDTSIPQAIDAGAKWVIIGHSERRALGETNADVRKKVAAVIEDDLKPIICVGEQERDTEGAYLRTFSEQVITALAGVPKGALKDVTIAYEPVWAIGGTETVSPSKVHETVLYIRKLLFEVYGKPALSIPILYGGSVEDDDVVAMMTEGEVQGVLVGHASVDAKRFPRLIKRVKEARA